MVNDNNPTPRQYLGVMVSSTFTDLEQHRAALIKAIKGEGFTDVAMENDSAKPDVDIIDSSLKMVQDASAYIGIISHNYGQIPVSPERNPSNLSLTELEFNEAQRLERPILLFIMGDDHPVRKSDVEIDPIKREKLEAFRERAKKMKPDSQVHRVYKVFNDLHEFEVAATHSIADLRRHLDYKGVSATQIQEPVPALSLASINPDPIPVPPAFYAEPPYIGSHQFVGRRAQLEILSDWAAASDPHPVLLFDAIGGSGKSMLTWEWTTKHAIQLRDDWAGRFWYSFYERGAIMADFCQHALAYITGQPLDYFRKLRTPQLGELLLHHLQARPWLLILDGIERVLVVYHRIDAAQVPDEEVSKPTDYIAHRDPCASIQPDDDDLLRALAAVAPSKILITTRLVPRALLNRTNQPIPGIRRESLPGLRPADAEELFRSCGINGDSQAIQIYLKRHCDCHPLVTGVLAGLVNDYLPDRGNFDTWLADPAGSGQLNLANLNLIQKRNHIFKVALDKLPEKSSQLLTTLALLSEAVDYPTLKAFNPHLPPEQVEVKEPSNPESDLAWSSMDDASKEQAQQQYKAALLLRKGYEQAVRERYQSLEFRTAPQELTNTVHDLEKRGLLQYDNQTSRYDLHPVVRGVAAGGLQPKEKELYGQRVLDYFSQKAHNPYEQAETLDGVHNGLNIVHTLLSMGRYQQAYDTYNTGLADTLLYNLEAYAEILSLLQPFFPLGWAVLSNSVDEIASVSLAKTAGMALLMIDESQEALAIFGAALLFELRRSNWKEVGIFLRNISWTFGSQNRLAKEEHFLLLALELATLIDDKENLFLFRMNRFGQLETVGQWIAAETMWQSLDPIGSDMARINLRSGTAETLYAVIRFDHRDLEENHLVIAEELVRKDKNRPLIRLLCALRGEWYLEQGRWELAAQSLHEAVLMARMIGMPDVGSETQLALAKFRLGQLSDPRREAENLAHVREPFHRGLAGLWMVIGDNEQAKMHALAAYKLAWADGEPYVYRYELNKTIALLESLGVEIPVLPSYDAAKDEKLPWEDQVVTAIENLRREKKTGETLKTNK